MSPAVFFVPVEFVLTGQPIAMLADPIDPATGELLSIERGFDPVDAAVINALRTVRESGSAVESVGHKLGDAKLIKSGLDTFLREEIRLALQRLTTTNQIKLLSVEVAADPADETAIGILVTYLNVARGKEQTAYMPMNGLVGRAAA